MFTLIKTKQRHVIGKVTSYETFIGGETFWVETQNTLEHRKDENEQ